MPLEKTTLGLPGFVVKNVQGESPAIIEVRYEFKQSCPHCGSQELRTKDSFIRKVRHETFGTRASWLWIDAHKYLCLSCQKYFNSRFPGILPYRRATEPFRREVFEKHHAGIPQSTLAKSMFIGAATIERWYKDHLQIRLQEMVNNSCPRILGIDEHFFTRKKGYATTFCDLRNHKIFDVKLGRSEESLKRYLSELPERQRCQIVVMDLSETYRSIAKRWFQNAMIVADRFHVIRLINHQFLKTWQLFDPLGRKNRGLLSLMRRHEENLAPHQRINLIRYFKEFPALQILWTEKQKLCRLMLQKHQTARECRKLIPEFLDLIEKFKTSGFEALQTLGKTLDSWKEEIARMWRFTKTNSITEGFHNKMETINRRAYGFKNFENYRLRVRVLCS
jgi:transposase